MYIFGRETNLVGTMRNAAETSEKLLRTAMALICQSSYHQVGVNEICKQAGVTKGAFYHHFQSKAELYYQATQLHWNETKPDFDRITSSDYTPLEQLQNLIDMITESHQAEGAGDELAGCSIISAGCLDGGSDDIVAQCSQEMALEIQQHHRVMIRNLKSAGMLNSDRDPAQIGRLLYQYIQGLVNYGRVFNDHSGMRSDLTEMICSLLDLKPEYRYRLTSESLAYAAGL